MKRFAFTILELIFVIIIIAILFVTFLPHISKSNLQEAVDQLIQHIRLTQSLAMTQNFYLSDASQSNDYSNVIQQKKSSIYWFKRWWQIQFHYENSKKSSYSIYSDHPSVRDNAQYSADPDYALTSSRSDIIAIDPYSGLYIMYNAKTNGVPLGKRFENVDFGTKYSVKVNMKSCSYINGVANSNHILFDYLGRPHCGKAHDDRSLNPYDHLVNKQIQIVLTQLISKEKAIICIEPESGYTHRCG